MLSSPSWTMTVSPSVQTTVPRKVTPGISEGSVFTLAMDSTVGSENGTTSSSSRSSSSARAGRRIAADRKTQSRMGRTRFFTQITHFDIFRQV